MEHRLHSGGAAAGEAAFSRHVDSESARADPEGRSRPGPRRWALGPFRGAERGWGRSRAAPLGRGSPARPSNSLQGS